MRLCLMVLVALTAVVIPARAERIIPIGGTEEILLRNRSIHDAVSVTLRYEVEGRTPALPEPLRLEPGEELVLRDIVGSLFGLTSNAKGELVVSGPPLVDAEWREESAGELPADWRPSIAVVEESLTDPVVSTRRRRAVRRGEAPEPLTLVRVGDVTSFSGSHAVSGTATLLPGNIIRLSNYRHDGTAPGLDYRIGLSTGSRRSFLVLRVTGRQAFSNATLDIPLPPTVSLNSFDTFTVWCFEFAVIIAEGQFRRP